jgi:WD40 repeat protein
MDLTPDGTTLVTIGRGELRAWDLTTGKQLASIACDGSSVRVDSRGQAVTFGEDRICVWDLRARKCTRAITHAKMPRGFNSRSLAIDRMTDTIYLIDFHPALAAVRTDGTWVRPPRSRQNARPTLALTPDGATLLQADPDVGITLRAWDVATGKARWSASLTDRPGVSAVAVLPDGRRAMVATGPGFVTICDLERIPKR